jgi:hypothetical protein
MLSFELKQKSKFISVSNKDTYAIATLKNGKKRKMEFYNGSGYLSQDSRFIDMNDEIASLSIFDAKNTKREIRNSGSK